VISARDAIVEVLISPSILVLPSGAPVAVRDGSTTPIRSLADAEKLFGLGSLVHRFALRHFGAPPAPPKTPEQVAADDARRAARERECDRNRLAYALVVVGQCIELVDAHATALCEADGSSSFTLHEWRDLARAALGDIYERSPELLPIGPDVHRDCGDDR